MNEKDQNSTQSQKQLERVCNFSFQNILQAFYRVYNEIAFLFKVFEHQKPLENLIEMIFITENCFGHTTMSLIINS